MSGRGGIYRGPNGEKLHGDGREVIASPVPDRVIDAPREEQQPPQLAKLLYRLWELYPGTPPADLDIAIVQSLQPWVEQLKAGDK